ncbi:SIR2 family NAD-dependent protein deacylase [Candidatus Nitrospira bockiana]
MSDVIPLHDAQKTLSDLRDHLARHDKPIAFLFGAGASASVQVQNPSDGSKMQPLIPGIAGLTKLCREHAIALGEKYAHCWNDIETHIKESKQDPNVEAMLSRLRMMVNAIGKSDTLSGLKKNEIEHLEEALRKTIAKVVTPELRAVPNDWPHRKFAKWLARTSRQKAVEIFTLNYDVLIEYALEAERIPVFDGFVGAYRPFFNPDSLRRLEAAPGSNWTRLWKMHGSVTWQRINQDGRMRVVRGQPDSAGEMIYPSFEKYDESRQQPYSAFTERLSRFLEQDDALLIVAGFSFGDEHINNILFGALENRPRTHVYALQFNEMAEDSSLVRRAYQRPNMIVIGPETGIIGGRRAKWAPLEHSFFMEEQTAGQGEGKAGIVKIGDFNSFCNFLNSMAPA